MALVALARLSLLKSDAFLNITDSNSDNVLKALLIAATQYANRFTNRTLESTAYTDQYHDGKGSTYLWLREYPVSTLTTVKIFDGTAYTTESSTYYELLDSRYIHYPKLTQQSNGTYSCFPVGKNNVAITYTAGYVTTNWDTEAITTDFSDSGGVPQDLELAVASLAAYEFRRRGASGIASESYGPAAQSFFSPDSLMETGGLPAEVAQTLRHYVKHSL